MQFNLKRTVLAYLWLLVANVNCLPGMLRSNREIASKLSCEISQQVDELLQIDKTLDNQFGILRTLDGYSLIFHNLENSYLENQVIVTVNKKRQVEFNNYLQYQEYGFEQFIIEGLNYIYTKTKFASQEGMIVHILSMYQQGQVKQQIYETQRGLQYNFKLNEQQDYFIQIIFATTLNNDFIGSQQQIENIIKTLNLGQECKPNTCSNDQEFIDLIQNIDLHQQNPKLISLAQYRTRQSIYNYQLVNNIYISSIQSKEIVRQLSFTDECIQIMSKQHEINNIQIEFEQYFCVANLIQSIRFTSTQFSQKQLNYLIVLQQSPNSDSEQLIDQLIQLVSSLKCMKDKKYDKLIQSQSLFLQSSQISPQEIATNTEEFQQNNVEVESISFDLQQPIKEETQQVVEKSFSDDIFDQPKQVEEQQHQQRLNEVEKQLAKTQEISEPINFDKQVNTEQVEQPMASTTTTEQIVFDEYNSQNQDLVSIPPIKEENIQQLPIISQEKEEVKSELQEQSVNPPKINQNETTKSEQLTKESDDYSDYHSHHHHHHHRHHHQHQNFIHNNHNEQEEYENDENIYESELRTTNLRGKRNKEDADPIIADKIVIEYNFVHQQPAKKGNVNSDRDKKKQEKDQEEEQGEEEIEEKEEKKPKKNCKPKKEEQEKEIEAADDNKEEDKQSNDKKPKCQKKKNNKSDEEQQADSGTDENESNNNEQEQQEEEQNEEPKEQKKKKCKKNKDQDQNETDNVEVDQEKEYDRDMLEDQFCRRQRSREDQYMRQQYDNGNGLEDELYWRYKHMKRQQIPYPFNGYPYKHRKQSIDHSPFPHANSYYKKHPFSIPSTNQAPWVGRDFFPDTGYGMGRVMDAYKGRYSDPEQVLKDLAIKNKQQKQWREQVQRYREQVGYGDEYQYFDQNYYDSPNQPFTEPQEQVYDYLNDSQYKFRQGKKPLEKPIRNSIEQREIEREYQQSDCFVIYDQCHYQGRRLQLCGEYPDIPSNIQGFKIFSFIIPDNLELRFFQSSDYENNIKDVEGSEECLEVPYELIPQQ